jgi:extracellular elastinolytic metalloproteinase
VLYSHSTMHHALGRGLVYEFSPGIAPDRREVPFPRPLEDYPAMPSTPLVPFPPDWIDASGRAAGNSTLATLGTGSTTLQGALQEDGTFLFHPQDAEGDDQKVLNIFYFCCYMHDFLYILGFDEPAGNFQSVNFTNTGLGNDPVRARAHSGPVVGTANMATGPDGQPPLMNMGLVQHSSRHTAFDFDVVAHEYVHGLTNRLVGGRMNASALDELQSGGMGEGWSDYFALTLQSYLIGQEKTVCGDWVVANPAGIRRAPYDDRYPFDYGDLVSSPRVHDMGEVWCAALMAMTRLTRRALGDDRAGYRLGWQIVVDGLKLTPPNPTFLDGRDAVLRALDDMLTANHLTPAIHASVRRAAWEAFARYGMGALARSADAGVEGILADHTMPGDLIV